MKKTVLISLSFIFLLTATALAAGEIDVLTVSIDDEGIVTIEGRAVDSIGKQITIKVIDPEGGIDYLNQIEVDPAGRFTLTYKLINRIEGIYRVVVGGDNIATHHECKFIYPPQQVAIGDIDANGKIDVADAILVLRGVVGLLTFEPRAEMAADVNNDGRIDVADAILILRKIVGLIDVFSINENNCGAGILCWPVEPPYCVS